VRTEVASVTETDKAMLDSGI